MGMHDTIQWIKAQLVASEGLLSTVENHPMMKFSIEKRIESLKEELSLLQNSNIEEPKLRLLFSGKSVYGSKGIKASFVSKTIYPIQELIKTQTAIIKSGNNIGKRGKVKKSAIAELYLTSLSTGSFGYELSMVKNEELFDVEDVSNAIKKVITVIEETSISDESFRKVIEDLPKRTLNNLKNFFQELANEGSILKIESGSKYVEISSDNIKLSYARVSETEYKEKNITVKGIFKGILLDSGRFESLDNEGRLIKGIISEDITEDIATQYNKEFTNEECMIEILETVTLFKNERNKTSYELIKVN